MKRWGSRLALGVGAVGIALGLTSGCGSATGDFAYDRLAYPASMSAFLYDDQGDVTNKKRMRVVGQFKHEERFWMIGWNWIPLSGTIDIGEEMNAAIKAKGGVGIINLTVSAEACSINRFIPLQLIPIYPACVTGVTAGEIVKVLPAKAAVSKENEAAAKDEGPADSGNAADADSAAGADTPVNPASPDEPAPPAPGNDPAQEATPEPPVQRDGAPGAKAPAGIRLLTPAEAGERAHYATQRELSRYTRYIAAPATERTEG